MNLDIPNWKEFRVGDLFDIHPTKAIEGLTSDDCSDDGTTPLVVNQSYNNGVAGKCSYDATEKGGIITFSDTWEGETFFYQEDDFIGFAHVQGMYPKITMSEGCLLFISTVLEYEARDRYSYGRKKRRGLIKESFIRLPAGLDGGPDWRFMEDYVRSLHHKPLTTKNKKGQAPDLNVSEWKEFRVCDVLNCDSTILSVRDELLDGATPFVSRTAENNGVDGYVDVKDDKITEGNCLTVGAEGVYAFYQPESFATGNKIYQMRRVNMNRYIGLFLATILNLEDYRYSYGRARIMGKLKDEIIKLPVDPDGEPDWQFMENYIKSLPYGDRL